MLVVPLRDLATQLTLGELRQRRCDLWVKSGEIIGYIRKVFGLSLLCFKFANPRENVHPGKLSFSKL